STVFTALSKSFFLSSHKSAREGSINETDYFLSAVTEKTCQECFMKRRCWQTHFDKTYSLMENIKDNLLQNGKESPGITNSFENHCVRSKRVLEVMEK